VTDEHAQLQSSRIFQEWAQLPIPQEEFQTKIRALQAKHFPYTKPLPGAEKLLQTLKKAPVQIALATSSHHTTFHLKTKHLDEFFAVFDEEHKVLGDDPRIPTGKGKPAPDIYFLALKTINDRLVKEGETPIYPEECLVFEDSVPGAEAGRRAGMQVLWCPHEGLLNEYKGKEKEVLAGLTGEHKESEGEVIASAVKDDVPGKEERTHRRVEGKPGEIDDGWAVLVKSLEDFPYEWFGIEIGEAAGS
jgi:pseudouridine-5'-monophosphatase